MNALYEKNLKFFEQHYRLYASWVKSMGRTAAVPIYEDGTRLDTDYEEATPHTIDKQIVNLDIGGRLLYPEENAIDSVEKQIEKNKEKPDRLYISLGQLRHHTLRSNKALKFMLEENTRRNPNKIVKHEFEDEMVVCFGIGLGHHIDAMVDAFDISYLFITECQREFLYYSMFVTDWEALYHKLEEKGGHLSILCNDYHLVQEGLIRSLREIGISRIDGVIQYMHYPSAYFSRTKQYILKNMAFIASNLGFFEDETVMIVHALQNFYESSPAYFWYQKQRYEKLTPIVVVGSAPSLDHSIETLKQIAKDVIIISCGTALRVLLKNGIKPDFHTLIENTINQVQVIEELTREFDVSDITVLTSASVYYKALTRFKRKIIFFRDHLCTEALWPSCPTVNYTGPMVSNLGLRFAISMGFKNIYLLGIDLGSRDRAQHHSKDSFYYIHGERIESVKMFSKDKKEIKANIRPANFGGQVNSNHAYDITLLFKNNLIKIYPDVNVYNCSDGVRIEKATPILLEVAAQQFGSMRRDGNGESIDLRKCFQELDYIEDAASAYIGDFSQMRRRIKRYTDQLIKKTKEETSFSVLLRYFHDELMNDHGHNELDCYRRMLRGTIFTEFTGINYFFRRLPDQQFADFFPWLKEVLIHELNEMRRTTDLVLTKAANKEDILELVADAYDKENFLREHNQEVPLELIQFETTQEVHAPE